MQSLKSLPCVKGGVSCADGGIAELNTPNAEHIIDPDAAASPYGFDYGLSPSAQDDKKNKMLANQMILFNTSFPFPTKSNPTAYHKTPPHRFTVILSAVPTAPMSF